MNRLSVAFIYYQYICFYLLKFSSKHNLFGRFDSRSSIYDKVLCIRPTFFEFSVLILMHYCMNIAYFNIIGWRLRPSSSCHRLTNNNLDVMRYIRIPYHMINLHIQKAKHMSCDSHSGKNELNIQ